MRSQDAHVYDDYEGRFLPPSYEIYRRHWPMDTPTNKFPITSGPSLRAGDLVSWEKHPDDGYGKSRMFENKRTGIVIATRWVLCDWMKPKKESLSLLPEALILWEDGETTNTTHGCLKILA